MDGSSEVLSSLELRTSATTLTFLISFWALHTKIFQSFENLIKILHLFERIAPHNYGSDETSIPIFHLPQSDDIASMRKRTRTKAGDCKIVINHLQNTRAPKKIFSATTLSNHLGNFGAGACAKQRRSLHGHIEQLFSADFQAVEHAQAWGFENERIRNVQASKDPLCKKPMMIVIYEGSGPTKDLGWRLTKSPFSISSSFVLFFVLLPFFLKTHKKLQKSHPWTAIMCWFSCRGVWSSMATTNDKKKRYRLPVSTAARPRQGFSRHSLGNLANPIMSRAKCLFRENQKVIYMTKAGFVITRASDL